MKVVHVCLCGDVFNEHYAYQDNILPKYHRLMGNDVTIIAPTYSEYNKETGEILSEMPGKRIIDNGIELIRLKPALPSYLNKHIHVFSRFLRTIEELAPDLVFVHGVHSLNYRSLIVYKKKYPAVKIVYDNHADSNNSCRNKLSYYYTRLIVRHFVVNRIKETSDFFYGVTPARCIFLNKMYGVPQSKIHLLPMGADDEEMHITDRDQIRAVIREQYGISDKDFLIVTGGKIDPLKNIHVLAQAVARTKYKNIKILIFGSIREDLKGIFEALESNRVQCVGWLPSNQVYRYFYAADIVVFPGLHSVLWEQAVASQVPCAFSKIAGFEHVDIGGNCVLMEGKSEDYYLNLIEKVYIDKDFYDALYHNAHLCASNLFLYSRIAQKVIDDVSGSEKK